MPNKSSFFLTTISTWFASSLAGVLISFFLASAQSQPLPRRLPPKVAPQDLAAPEEELVAIVQYLKNDVVWRHARQIRPLEFQTRLFTGEGLITRDDSMAKIVTMELCTGVAYENSLIAAPTNVAGPWQVKGQAFRWICPQSGRSQLSYQNVIIVIEPESEILLREDRLLVLRGEVSSAGTKFETKKIYVLRDKQWRAPEETLTPRKTWTWNQEYPIPKEGFRWPRPSRQISTRWSLGPSFGGAIFEHDNSTYSLKDLDAESATLQSNFLWNNQSWLVAIHWSMQEHGSKYEWNEPSPPPADFPPGAFSRTESWTIDVGWRNSHTNSLSYFYRFGLGQTVWHTNYHFIDKNGLFLAELRGEKSFAVATASIGADYLLSWSFMDWLALWFSAELRLTRSLTMTSDRAHFYHDPARVTDPESQFGKADSGFWSAEILFRFAPTLQFE